MARFILSPKFEHGDSNLFRFLENSNLVHWKLKFELMSSNLLRCPQISKTDISKCHRVPSRNLRKEEGLPIVVKIVRRQSKSGLMVNEKSLKDCDEKSLSTTIAEALRLRADIKSVVMLNEKMVIYKTDESKYTLENLFKLNELNTDSIYPVCETRLHFC